MKYVINRLQIKNVKDKSSQAKSCDNTVPEQRLKSQ